MHHMGQVDPDLLRRHVMALADRPRGRRHSPRAMEQAEKYVAGALTAAGWQVYREPFDVGPRLGSTDRHGQQAMPLKLRLYRGLSGANVRAELPGAGRLRGPGGTSPPTLVIGAHLDTAQGSPGSDDNASGVAVILEVARVLGRLAVPPVVTLMIFDMEELGLIGSRQAVRCLLRTDRTVGGMMSLESVGFFSAEPGSQRLPAGARWTMPEAAHTVRRRGHRGDFTLIVHRSSSRILADTWSRAAAAASPVLPTVLLRDPRPDGPLGAVAGLAVPALGNLDRSDHSPFWNNKIPAVMLTSTANFRNPYYHRPGDTADTLDYQRLASVATATLTTAMAWCERK